MSKQIDVHDIEKGMYVSELDRPWTGTPFLFQGFEIRTDEQIAQLQRLCRHVYVAGDIERTPPSLRDSAKLLGVEPALGEEPASRIDTRYAEILKQSQKRRIISPQYDNSVTLEEEIAVARTIEATAREIVYTLTDDVTRNRSLDSQRVRSMIAGMVGSITRNPDALIWLTHLRNKDEYTALHSIRVAIFALAFGRHLDLSVEELNILGVGALLHDIGKLKVPHEILNKPGRFTPQEYEIMKTHVSHGVGILEGARGIPMAAVEVARCHHERYAGTGYVYGLSGDRIGLFGLIGAIVDTYDAITSDRSYHAGISASAALSNLYKERNKDFHGGLVDQFIQCMGIYPIGSIVEINTGSVGVVITVNRHRRLRPKVALVFDANKQPCPKGTIVDLAHSEAIPGGRVIEIRRVLAAGTHGIDPSAYLPASS